MNLVYGISRWTNPSRASARHIDNGSGKPLCESNRKVSSWEKEQGQPTCKACINKYKRLHMYDWNKAIQEISGLKGE